MDASLHMHKALQRMSIGLHLHASIFAYMPQQSSPPRSSIATPPRSRIYGVKALEPYRMLRGSRSFHRGGDSNAHLLGNRGVNVDFLRRR